MRARPRWGRRLVALAGATALVGGISAAPAASGAAPECPNAVPIASVEAGMKGTGYTVAKGTQPEPFDVEVLGVLRNPYLPVRDMIVVEASSPDIDRAGGVWYGMSGSPVYIGDRLLGAVAFGLSFGPSKIVGLTAAEDMIQLLNRPAASPAATPLQAQRVKLSAAMRTRIAEATGADYNDVGGTMTQLRVPLSVSGLSPRGMRGLRHFLRENKIAAVPYAGASVTASQTAEAAAVEPGSNFAAALSYGDLTLAAIGTTTFVCQGKAVAFGHPFFFEGRTLLGANAATALTVVDDPVFSPYKLARVEGSIGTVDQDRFAGVRAILNGGPRTIPVTSTTTSVDAGTTTQGKTDVVFGQDVIEVSVFHLFLSILATQDQFGEGSGTMSWTVRGTRRSGDTWRLDRSNMYTSRWGLAYDMLEEYHWQMHRIDENRFEPVEFTGVQAKISVREDIQEYALASVRVSTGGRPYRSVRRLTVRAGARIELRATLVPFQGTANRIVNLTLRVPRASRGIGQLEVASGQACIYECRHPGVTSFSEFLRAEANQPHNNDLLARIYAGERRPTVVARSQRILDKVITGGKSILLRIVP